MGSQPDPKRPYRPDVMARHHMVISGHYWASMAGFQILEAGGNAIDAGVATGIAINILQSEFTSFGGVGPAMIYLADRNEVVTISGVGTWPAAASCEYFHEHFGGIVPQGILDTIVPAAPDIWITALEEYGTISFGDAAAAAIRFARDGFPMYPIMASQLEDGMDDIKKHPTTAAIYLPGGRPPEVGKLFFQKDLAGSLQYLADEESVKAGRGREAGLQAARDAFYKGDIARAIVRQQVEMGGLLTAEDLAGFRAEIEAPQRVVLRDGTELYGCGPFCQGPMVLETLAILDGIDFKAMGHNSPAYIHTVTEAMKLAAADREVYFGDTNFVDVPMTTILSDDFIDRRRALFDPKRAWPEMPPHGEIAGFDKPPWKPDPSARRGDQPAGLDTSYLCAADRKGNVFSVTPSDGSTGGPVIAGTGIKTSTWGSRAYTDPTHPACVGPGRRPRMSCNPMMAMRDGKMLLALGSPGSEVLGQAQIQAFLSMTVFGMSPQAAAEKPRFASYSWPTSQPPHDYIPAGLTLEEDIGKKTAKALADLGHQISWWPVREWLAGSICAIQWDQDTGIMHGGADHRLTAYAIGW